MKAQSSTLKNKTNSKREQRVHTELKEMQVEWPKTVIESIKTDN